MEYSHYWVLLPMLLFYGTYLTKTILLQRQGIDVNRLVKGDKPQYTRLLERMLVVVTYAMPILQVVGVWGSLPTLRIGFYHEIIGLVVALIGCASFICAVIAMKSSWRAGIDSTQETTLQTSGILKYSRNPAFLGFDLFYVGVALMIPNIFLFTFVAIALIVFHLQILEEEKFLSTTFGTAYIQYKERTGRYV
jgi:protein-S-isoprenylcysteine O-methyltransferase Ste14